MRRASEQTERARRAADDRLVEARERLRSEVEEADCRALARIEEGERGNIAFGVHRSTDNPNEFWLYETWASEDAVEAHESGEAFERYKRDLRPLVDPDSVIFGNTVPLKVLGYELPAGETARD